MVPVNIPPLKKGSSWEKIFLQKFYTLILNRQDALTR